MWFQLLNLFCLLASVEVSRCHGKEIFLYFQFKGNWAPCPSRNALTGHFGDKPLPQQWGLLSAQRSPALPANPAHVPPDVNSSGEVAAVCLVQDLESQLMRTNADS